MLNVLVAEDDVHVSINLSNEINTNEMRCIGILNDGTKVLQKIKEKEPDFLILDLKMPGRNGIQILEEIEKNEQIKTKVIVYSGEVTYMTLTSKFRCIERFYTKLTATQEIARQLKIIAENMYQNSINQRITEILLKIGFTYTLKGTRLIHNCILYSINNEVENINEIYNQMASDKKCNVHTIKSDIYTAINNMWRYADKTKVRKLLRIGDTDNPSSKNIIFMAKYYVKKYS